VQKFGRSTKDLIFGKMKGGVSKEEAERLSHLGRDRQQVVVEHKEEEEGIERETELRNERRKIVSFSNGGRLMFI
jgi:hypothetical protein